MAEQSKEPEVCRSSSYYFEGRNAFLDGKKVNPYQKGSPRMDWFTGWYDARSVDKYGPEFDWSKPENIPPDEDDLDKVARSLYA